MNVHRSTPVDAVQLLRHAARDLGIPESISPEAAGIALETADEFVARMKRADRARARADRLATQGVRRRTPTLCAAAVAVALLVLTVVQPWHGTRAIASTPPPLDYEFVAASKIAYAPGRDPRAGLRELSRVAAGTEDRFVAGGAQHITTIAMFARVGDSGPSYEGTGVPRIQETWLGADGAVRTSEESGQPLGADGRGLAAGRATKSRPLPVFATRPSGSVDAGFVETLPTDVAGLRSALLRRGGCVDGGAGNSRSVCLYTQIVDLYGSYVIPQRVASTFWAMLAQESDFRLLGRVEDRARRAGIGVSIVPAARSSHRYVMIISRTTGQLLGTEDILIKRQPELAIDAPAIMGFTAILSANYVATPPPVASASGARAVAPGPEPPVPAVITPETQRPDENPAATPATAEKPATSTAGKKPVKSEREKPGRAHGNGKILTPRVKKDSSL